MTKIKLQDVKNAVDLGKDLLPIVAPVFELYAPKVADQIQKKAKQVSDGAGDAKESVLKKIQQRKDGMEQKAALERDRKKAVAGALPSISAEEFFNNFEANVMDGSELDNGFMAITGCYAILTLKSPREKDLSAYKDVYVGCSKSVGFSVYSQFRGFGNIDVYADFKFKEPMRVLVYPCEEEDLEGRFASLVRNLQAVDSYNKWDVLHSSDGEN